jgi:hypothetical protein
MANDPKVSWYEVNLSAIQVDANTNAWHTGHVNHILPRGDGALVGTSTGGVWLAAANAAAVVLTDLDDPDITCLAEGSNGPDHYFASCGASSNAMALGALYETYVTEPVPLYSWHAVPGIPPEAGTIFRVAVIKDKKIAVIACQGGVWWSNVPTATQPQGCGCLLWLLGQFPQNPIQGSYAWTKAQGLPDGPYYGLVLGPNHTVVVGAFGNASGFGPLGIYQGSFQGNQLVFTAASITGMNPASMCATAVAACANTPSTLYAISSASNTLPLGVLRSTDGGKTWSACGTKIAGAPIQPGTNEPWTILTASGAQGNGWNNCLAVSASDPNTVAFGWEYPFISTDAGKTWKGIGITWNPGGTAWNADANMHPDQHALAFDPNSPSRIYFGNDGGLSRSDDLGSTVSSEFSKQVLNLEFFSTYPMRQFGGSMSASPLVNGLIAGGTQDNGNLWCLAGEFVNGSLQGQTPWLTLIGGDGGACQFIATGQLLHTISNDGLLRVASWDGANQVLNDQGPVPVQQGASSVAANPEPVRNPTWKNAANELMYAVAGSGKNLFGVFAKSDGTNLHLELLATLPLTSSQYILGVGSFDGTRVLAGSQEGRIFSLDTASSTLTEGTGLPALATKNAVSRIVPQSNQVAYLILNGNGFVDNGPFQGWVYQTQDGKTWSVLSGLPNELFYALEIDPTSNPPDLYVATDGAVYDSHDGGMSWGPASLNLPVRPHCGDLRFVTPPDGISFLYLSTFGRSIFRAQLHPQPAAAMSFRGSAGIRPQAERPSNAGRADRVRSDPRLTGKPFPMSGAPKSRD